MAGEWALKLTYLYHSGFLLETDSCYVLFDYFLDGAAIPPHDRFKGGVGRAIGAWDSASLVEHDEIRFMGELKISVPNEHVPGVVATLLLNLDKPLYVLVSHFHKDHFLPFIFKFADYAKKRRSLGSYPEIKYVISTDVRKYRRKFCEPYEDLISYLAKGEIFEDELLKVSAFGSTDVGLSFGVTVKEQNFNVFHAGDLNYWHWQEESTKEEIEEAHDFFKREMAFIAERCEHFDLVMFPCDPRMVNNFLAGAEEFLEQVPFNCLVPMHVWEEPQKVMAALTQDRTFASWVLNLGHVNELPEHFISLHVPHSIWMPINSGDTCNLHL